MLIREAPFRVQIKWRRPSLVMTLGRARAITSGAGETGRLCGGPLPLVFVWLKAMQIIGGALRMAGGCEDETLVVLQNLK